MSGKAKKQKDFEPGRGYAREDWDSVSDNPPLTEDERKAARPFRAVFPDLAENLDKAIAARGRPKAAVTKTPVTIRLDPDVVEHYRAMGKGWQSRMNEDLRKLMGR